MEKAINDYKYHNRDISWLSFNYRVLMEAADPEVPLYERLKFLAIYSSNLDEFFRVRVASLRSIVNIDKKKINKKFIKEPVDILEELLTEVNKQLEEFGSIKRELLLPALKKEGIVLYRDERIEEEHRNFVEHYFKSKVLSYMQPIIFSIGGSKKKVFLENREIYLIVEIKSESDAYHYAHIKIPTGDLPRFVRLPQIGQMHYYIALDDIIKENINFLFPGYEVLGSYSVKLNRDADLNIEDEYSGDLVKKIQKQIKKRNLGVPSRFLYDRRMPGHVLDVIIDKFRLDEEDIVPGGTYHNMNDLMSLENPLSPNLEGEAMPPIRLTFLENGFSLYDKIENEDILLHFPYQSYDYVLQFFNEAALNPNVEEIKATFYRIAPNSFISNALISAAHNGKKVTVFVEIKARFDEQNNLSWAEKMKKAGVSIIYSIPGLKVHAKVALIKKKDKDGEVRKYGYFGTGNFNEKTASIYADEALLTTDEQMTNELDELFLYLDNKKETVAFSKLLVSQFNIVDSLTKYIDKEIENAKAGREAKIIAKLNNLEDDYIISKLYEASNAGVKIELIVRAICCIIPGVKGMSENIVVRRIVDRYLEHSRVYYFFNGGEESIFMGSADWMKRNLYRRIEVSFPIHNQKARQEIMQLIDIQLNDNVKATYIDQELRNVRVKNNKPKVRSQEAFYNWLKEEYN